MAKKIASKPQKAAAQKNRAVAKKNKASITKIRSLRATTQADRKASLSLAAQRKEVQEDKGEHPEIKNAPEATILQNGKHRGGKGHVAYRQKLQTEAINGRAAEKKAGRRGQKKQP